MRTARGRISRAGAVWLASLLFLMGCQSAGTPSATLSSAPTPQVARSSTPAATMSAPSRTLSPTEAPSPKPMPTASASPLVLTFPPFPKELLIGTLPEACPMLGHQVYEEAPLPDIQRQGAERSPVLKRGQILVVTTDSDEANGDTSTVEALVQNPGFDGSSLREALLATNNDPGEYTIQFDPGLAGVTIPVGSWNQSELPPLSGGSVIINGDLDGDGETDITLENAAGAVRPGSSFFCFTIHSSLNTLHALRLIGFGDAVLFDSPSSQQVYTGNTSAISPSKGPWAA